MWLVDQQCTMCLWLDALTLVLVLTTSEPIGLSMWEKLNGCRIIWRKWVWRSAWWTVIFFSPPNLMLRRRSKITKSQASPLDKGYFCHLLLWVKDALDTWPLWILTATEFLSFEQYENMVTASVEVVGAVCRHLSWSAYLYHLKHFIHVLQTGQISTKLGVRWVPWTVLFQVSPKTP